MLGGGGGDEEQEQEQVEVDVPPEVSTPLHFYSKNSSDVYYFFFFKIILWNPFGVTGFEILINWYSYKRQKMIFIPKELNFVHSSILACTELN